MVWISSFKAAIFAFALASGSKASFPNTSATLPKRFMGLIPPLTNRHSFRNFTVLSIKSPSDGFKIIAKIEQAANGGDVWAPMPDSFGVYDP